MFRPSSFIDCMSIRVNIGCGQTPTDGWRNFDNSMSLKLAGVPVLPELLWRLGMLGKEQYRFIQFARKNTLEFADGRHLPLEDCSVEVLYSSHMLEKHSESCSPEEHCVSPFPICVSSHRSTRTPAMRMYSFTRCMYVVILPLCGVSSK